jgi:hypothetical protein
LARTFLVSHLSKHNLLWVPGVLALGNLHTIFGLLIVFALGNVNALFGILAVLNLDVFVQLVVT